MLEHVERTLAAAALIVSALATMTAVGQEAPPPAPLYQVEVLIFAYREFDRTEEQFEHAPPRVSGDIALREPPAIDESSFDPLVLRPPVTPETPAPGETESGFRVLGPDELQLKAEYQKIQRIAAYVPLAHGGWVQPGLPENEAQPVDMALLGIGNPTGTIRLHLSRFLHLTLDLRYQDDQNVSQNVSRGAPSADAGAAGLREIDLAPRYDLITERQTRSGGLQYFDHPAFGVLVKITAVPAAAPPGGRPAA
jgi:Peptidoglycan-binding protein, CsiV